MKKIIGAHLSISAGIYKIQEKMETIGAKSCGIFLKNQKRYESAPLKEEHVAAFKKKIIHPEHILPHGSYLINLGNPDTIEKSFNCLIDDLERCNALGISLYNLHPGSDVKKMGVKCLDHIAKYLNQALNKVPNVTIVIENMAGQGNVVCSKFEEIKYLLEKIEDEKRIGVCLDTCHMFGAGYDIRTKKKFENVMKDFDKIVGLKFLKGMHLNDSKEKLGTRKDRHESIGKGHIGLEAFEFIMNSDYFNNIPMILETPDPDKYKEEIQILKSLIAEN